ncbi:MAG: lipid II flippase MurJ, partial [Rhizobiales bacterium]|nr:lipid II flippase MurJ [Hyphomicrobiales bacterium]
MSLLKSAATVGGLTMVSRVLGFIRDQLVAFTVGTGPVAEAFFVALRFPNLFRALFAEGAFNSAFVPLFAKRIEGEGAPAARALAVEVFSVLLAWLVVFCAAAMVAMPWLMVVLAPG